MSFGARLRSLRTAAGLTQEELAERAGLSVNGIGALERGTRTSPYPHTVRALVAALGGDAELGAQLLALARGAAPERRSTLPYGVLEVPATELIGRDADAGELVDLLARGDARLVTLTGSGGVGKTRLAAEVATRLTASGSFADGVVVAALAKVNDAEAVPGAVAGAVGTPESTGDRAQAIVEHLGTRHLLLVLDNFEHVLDAAGLVARLLADCPQLCVLVTSRAPLQIRGEVERVVSPLPLPSAGARRASVIADAPAGRLFLERARAAVPGFDLTDSDAAHVAAICWRLGGLPLGIELAAPKLKLLSPAALLERLDQALAHGWARDLPARQRSVQATLDWSYDLLREPEQRLLALLGVFTGGFDVNAVDAVADGALDEDEVLAALDGLVTQSLVVVRRTDGGAPWYSLLEPVRAYALSRLAADPDALRAARRRHRAHFLTLAEQAAAEYVGPDQVPWLQRTEWESANIRAAIIDALADDDAVAAAQLCWAMWVAWWMSGHVRDGREFAAAALRRPLPPEVRIRATLVVAVLSFALGDVETARRNWTDAHEAATAIGEELGAAYAECGFGLADLASGRFASARAWLQSAVKQSERLDEQWMLSLCQIWIGTSLVAEDRLDEAVEYVARGLASARLRGDRLVSYVALFNLAEIALARGDLDGSAALLREGTALSVGTSDRANLAFYLDGLAVIAVEQGAAERAARLFGAAAAMRHAAGAIVYRYYLPDEKRLTAALERARAELAPDVFDAAFAAGQALDLTAAAALATG